MRIHNIEITPTQARVGKRRSISRCPVAMAVRKNFDASSVSLGLTEGTWYDQDNSAHTFTIPWDLGQLIGQFDRGGEFEPGVYQIEEVRDA